MSEEERYDLENFIDPDRYFGRSEDLEILTLAKLKIERIIRESLKKEQS